MPDEKDAKKSTQPKTIEMRLAELEDKMAKVHITEDELKAYQKVAALTGGGAAPTAACVVQQCVQPCVVQQCVIHQCIVSQCIIRQCIIKQCIIQQCIIQQCAECGGGCAPGGGIAGGGGFGGLGG